MSKYSNVTAAEMELILSGEQVPRRTLPVNSGEIKAVSAACRFAIDTGELAFLRAPCRGNKIICQKVADHISFSKACNAEQCRFYQAK